MSRAFLGVIEENYVHMYTHTYLALMLESPYYFQEALTSSLYLIFYSEKILTSDTFAH